MFSKIFKIAISLSLLTAVSAMAQEVDHEADLGAQRDARTAKDTAARGQTQRTMKDSADKQAQELNSVDPTSAAARAAGRLAGSSQQLTALQLQIKSEAGRLATDIPDIGTRKEIMNSVAQVAQVDPVRGQEILQMVQRGVGAIHAGHFSAEGTREAIQLVRDEAKVAAISVADGRQNDPVVGIASAQDAIDMYVAQVEKEAISSGNKAKFKAADNKDLILKEYDRIHDAQKAIEKAKGTPADEIGKAIEEQAAYNVIASFHNKGDAATFMSEKDMRDLAREITKEKKC